MAHDTICDKEDVAGLANIRLHSNLSVVYNYQKTNIPLTAEVDSGGLELCVRKH